jgi:hypothetical protein
VALSFRVSGKERVIRPDAMLVHHAARRRVFIELDRSTECLSPQDGRRSITRKLEGYRTFLHGRASDARRWSEHVFADGYATRVLFVLSRRDSRAHDPENRDRRLRGILHRAAEVFGCADQSPIRCVYLDDAPGIAKVARLDAAHAEAPPPRRATVSSDEVTALSDLYDSFIALFQRVRRESRAREHARTVGRRARAVLERMQPDRKLSDPATFPGVRL